LINCAPTRRRASSVDAGFRRIIPPEPAVNVAGAAAWRLERGGGVNKGELVRAVAARAQMDPGQARRAVDSVIEEITARLGANEDVALIGFGKFSVVERGEREGVNPRNPGTRIVIPARRVPRFTPGSQLRQTVAGGPEGQPVLDPVSLMAGQPEVVGVEPPKGRKAARDPVEIMASQSEGAVVPAPEPAKPESGARARKAAGAGGKAAPASGGKSSKASGGQKASGASGAKASGSSTARRSGTRRTKEK
jgi:DNA-binding protein HU-beta